MRFLLYFLFLIQFSFGVTAQDVHSLIREAERVERLPNEKAAFDQFKIINKKFPGQTYVLSKCSELCSRIGNREKDEKMRDAYYRAAVGYAKQALQINSGSDDAHVAMAIALGRVSLLKGGKEKIAGAKEIKMHAEKALAINPNNFKAWHIIGKWNFEVSNLSMMERAATKVFYGGLPGATMKNAIAAYEKARLLSYNFLLNHLELAKAYYKNEENKKAIASLKVILNLPSTTEDDARIKAEAMSLIKKWD